MRPLIDHSTLVENLSYDPETGAFRWKARRVGVKHGQLAGSVASDRYGYTRLFITLFYRSYNAGRLAWFYVHKRWPRKIDHINGNPLDNRIVNLRSVSIQTNNKNRARRNDNSSGVTGVHWHKGRQRWRAVICRKDLGRFKNKADAIAARKKAEREHNFHPNTDRQRPAPKPLTDPKPGLSGPSLDAQGCVSLLEAPA